MRTMSDLELMNYAYDTILDRWYKETKFRQNFRKEYGVDEPITKVRIERYESQLEELRELIKQKESHLLIE